MEPCCDAALCFTILPALGACSVNAAGSFGFSQCVEARASDAELAHLAAERHAGAMKQTLDLDDVPEGALEFLQQFLVALITTVRPDETLHVAGVGFVYDPSQKRCYLIGQRDSVKVANIAAGSRAVVAQVDGSRWLSLEGVATIHEDAASVAEAERRYATRYPGHGNPMVGRVAIHIDVANMTGIWQRREPNLK